MTKCATIESTLESELESELEVEEFALGLENLILDKKKSSTRDGTGKSKSVSGLWLYSICSI